MNPLSYAIAINIMTEGSPREVILRCVWCIEKEDPHGEWSVRHIPGNNGGCMACPVNGPDVKFCVRPKGVCDAAQAASTPLHRVCL